jgi:cbb3-type cytochrome oxidase subunit 3
VTAANDLGIMPMSFVHVNTGLTLNSMNNFGSSAKQMVMLFGLSFIALLPSLLTKGKRMKNDLGPK